MTFQKIQWLGHISTKASYDCYSYDKEFTYEKSLEKSYFIYFSVQVQS